MTLTDHLAKNLLEPKRVATRDGFGQALVELGKVDSRIVVLSADLTESTRAKSFKDTFPERFIEIGVAEQNLVTVGSGLAAVGKIPFVTSYAMFCPGRCWEQIRTTIAYNNQPVKIAGAHSGISVGPDGATHQALEDVGIMRGIPNMVVIVPCDSLETRKATVAATQINSPVYLRFGREKTPLITTEQSPFILGKAEVYRDGEDLALIACGSMVYEALKAAEILETNGISAAVINSHTIKPLDKEVILAYAKKCGSIVTAEEHQVYNGLGSAVAETVSESYPVPVIRVGVLDRFGESGNPDELLDRFGLRAEDILIAAIKSLALSKPQLIFGSDHPTIFEAPPQTEFYLRSGKKLTTLAQLASELRRMPYSDFDSHLREGHNDFGAWIRDVFSQPKLAETIEKMLTPQDAAFILEQYTECFQP